MDLIFAPDFVPAFGRIRASVSENSRAMLHALLKFDGKRKQRGIGQFKMPEAVVCERDVYRALRLGAVPALAGGYIAEQASNQATRSRCVFKVQEEIARDGQVVAAQNKALNIGLVELTHFGRQS